MSLHELYYGRTLRIFIHGDAALSAVKVCRQLVADLGHREVDAVIESDLAIAPLLERKLAREEFAAPRLGTLIFHPSLLPVYRGRDAIKRAYRAGDSYTGVTWFWCADQLDAGSICEQAVVLMDRALRPRDFYKRTILRAMVVTLRWALEDLARDHIRRRNQDMLT